MVRDPAAGPRERLLKAAQELFYTQGASVGIGAVLQEANVARRSLYEHFGGKDGLVTEVLRRASEEDLAWYESALAGATEPRERLLGLFGHLDELVSDEGFRGCRYFATDLAFAEPDHPAHAETEIFRRRLHDLLVRELEAMNHPHPERTAEQLHLLIEGALVRGAGGGRQHPALAARDLAAIAIDSR
ncbi:TetR/AcrR family transcriptional regulator [Microlunatus speluncae]|uniref:TetR/AcrR family transcriptional regulator n=1 Tax=Microlunatus speluncae TaxID=2594267 RepID=UPI00126617EF|nr:TetR/AcrR family transcriptional regulator [Microlunatus speluncae]